MAATCKFSPLVLLAAYFVNKQWNNTEVNIQYSCYNAALLTCMFDASNTGERSTEVLSLSSRSPLSIFPRSAQWEVLAMQQPLSSFLLSLSIRPRVTRSSSYRHQTAAACYLSTPLFTSFSGQPSRFRRTRGKTKAPSNKMES